MTHVFILIFCLIATTTLVTARNSKPNPNGQTFILPVLKDNLTGLFYTAFTVGEQDTVLTLAIDVRGPTLWFDCSKLKYNSTSFTPIPCSSSRCKQKHCSTCSGPYTPYCTTNTCIDSVKSPFTSTILPTRVFDDNITLTYTFSGVYFGAQLTAKLPLSCALASDVQPFLPPTSNGILGLGNGSMSLVNSLVLTYKIPFIVALCLPSKSGTIYDDVGLVYIGGGPYLLPPDQNDVSGLFSSTPLIKIQEKRKDIGVNNVLSEDSYYIDVKSIEVNGKKLSLNQSLLTFNKLTHVGGTKISTTTPYTILQSTIYKAIVKAFAGKAKRVKAVKPFKDCFKSLVGPEIPVIGLGLGGGAKWKIYGENSLVKVNNDVVCLGFIDGGEKVKTSIVIGGHQMVDNLVEFDLHALKFSFTSSLLLHQTSCRRV